MKEFRVKCVRCGERFTAYRFERERVSKLCDLCREEVKREQARERMRQMRERRGVGPRQIGLDGMLYPH